MFKISSTIISLILFKSIVFAQLSEFSQGDVLSAGLMNQNFKYLEDRFGGLNEKTIDCGTSGTGFGINAAIKDGYNSIIVKGLCKENINWDSREGERGYLKLKGYSNDQTSDKIIDNSSTSKSVISLQNSYLKIDNLTISGGTRGIHVSGNSLLWADNVTVENYTQRGISVTNSSVGWLGSVTVDGTKQSSSDERGIWFINSDGYISGTTIVKGNSSSNGAINSSDNSRVWISGTANLDSNKASLVVQNGGKMGMSSSTQTTITNSTEYGIKAYFGEIWNYGAITITDNSDGNNAVYIDRSKAYLKNMNVTGGTGSDNLFLVHESLFMIEDSTIKNHQGLLFNSNRSTVKFYRNNLIINENTSAGCVVYFGDTDFLFEEGTEINGLNNSSCTAFNITRSRGEFFDITIKSKDSNAFYVVASDLKIRGGSFSSTNKKGIYVKEGSRLNIQSSSGDLSITSSGDDALEIRSSYVLLEKGSNDFTISSSSSGDYDISNRSFSTLDIENHAFSNIEVKDASNLIIDSNATITTLTCASNSNILKFGTVTDTSACSNAQ